MINWIQKLKVGDRVMIKRQASTVLRTVEQITEIEVITDSKRFNRLTGNSIGASGWYLNSISEATPKAIADLRARVQVFDILKTINNTSWHNLSIDKIKDVYAILQR